MTGILLTNKRILHQIGCKQYQSAQGNIEVKKFATRFENIMGIIATHNAIQAMNMMRVKNFAANSFPTS